VTIRLIVDTLWISLPEERQELFTVIQELIATKVALDERGKQIICAVGLGGAESSQNTAEIRMFLDRYRDLGLKVDIHSGEGGSWTQHQANLKALEPDRIAHGIAGAEHDDFFQGHIALCPISNVLTGNWTKGFDTHPIGHLWQKRHPISANTDDPLLYGTTLTLEYVALRSAFGLAEDFFHFSQGCARRAAFDPSLGCD
jgi:adenosine deaminase